MQFGDYRVEIIPDTEFRLDGGAMFGVVPRVLWEKKCPPDELNRITLNMNCLFVETPTEKILVETGIGEKWTEKQIAMYGIFREKTFAETLFEKAGCKPEDISIVVNTHLHFDHAGGNTIFEKDGQQSAISNQPDENTNSKLKTQNSELRARNSKLKVVPQFPNARYFVSASEFEHAENPHERDRASYVSENWQPVLESGQMELKPDEYELVEGLTMRKIRGHNETMQIVCLKRGGKTLCGFADLIPTTAHLSYAWIMGYDLFPIETLEAKKKLIPRAIEEDWICLFYHDNKMPLCRLVEEEGKVKISEI